MLTCDPSPAKCGCWTPADPCAGCPDPVCLRDQGCPRGLKAADVPAATEGA